MLVRHIHFVVIFFLTQLVSYAQTVCDPADVIGSNLVSNGDFESGDVGFTTDIPYSWNAGGGANYDCWSHAGEYYIGNSPQDNIGGCQFQGSWGYTAYEGNNYMMVDGDQTPGSVVWGQSVTGIEANTYYYFSVAVTSLSPGELAQLKFDINGVEQDTTLDAPATPGDWIVYNQVWYSGVTTGTINLEITDIRASSGSTDVNDYGLDAIVFEKGCPDDAFDDQPELGDDLTFCGTNGTITLDPGVVKDVDNFIYWSTGTNDNDETIDVTASGTYYVCVSETGTCTKIDSINISDDYSINIGDDTELCDPTEITMDAGHSGIGVSYQWYLDDVEILGATSKTLTVNNSGEYKVIVDDASCDEKKDSINVTVQTTHANPNDIGFCLENNPDTTLTFTLASSGTNYNWYDAENSATPLVGGTSVDSYTLTGVGPDGDTLWVEDNTLTTYPNTGPTDIATTSPGWGYKIGDYRRDFEALENLTIKNIDVKLRVYTDLCDGAGAGTKTDIVFQLWQNGSPTGEEYTATSGSLTCGDINTVPLELDVPSGTGYSLRISGNQTDDANGWFHKNDSETSEYTINNVFVMESWWNSGMSFNWEIEAESHCEKVPVYAYNNCLLPVEFAYFEVIKTSEGAILKWATATEFNNSHFEIQRSSDGRFYEVIGIVNGYGNSDNLIEYEFIDNTIKSGTYYYRLKQIDYDGAFDFSVVKSISNVEQATIQAYPNPFNETITLTISSLSDLPYQIEVYDVLGVPVYNSIIDPNESIEIGENFNPGVYLVNIWSGTDKQTIKIVKR